jgi:hypothetical protein
VGVVGNLTYPDIYRKLQGMLNYVLHSVTSQKTRIHRILVADSRSQCESDRPITEVQGAHSNDFSTSYSARLMSLLYMTAHTNMNSAEARTIFKKIHMDKHKEMMSDWNYDAC